MMPGGNAWVWMSEITLKTGEGMKIEESVVFLQDDWDPGTDAYCML